VKSRRPAKRRPRLEELEQRLVLSTTTSSSNWSGYAVVPGNGQVTSVSGTWTVPAVSGSGTAYSATWVGIDGFSSNTVEQIGTDSDLVNGTPQYYAWFEMYPAYPVNLSMNVQPGDTISASVTATASGLFTLSITDTPKSGGTAQTFTTTQSLPGAARSSAEWIVEAPSSGFGVLPLANFGTVNFSKALVNGGPAGAAPANQTYQINLVNSFGTQASTSALDSTGTNFSVSYHAPTVPPHRHHFWFWWFQNNDGGSSGTATTPTGTSGATSVATTTPTGASGSALGSTTPPTGTTTSTGTHTSTSTATSTTGALPLAQMSVTAATVLPAFTPTVTQATTAAPVSTTVSPVSTSLFILPSAAPAARPTSAGILNGGGGDQLVLPEDTAKANQPGVPADQSAPEANPDAAPTPTPTPVPTPAPDDVPANPDGIDIVRQRASDACFSAWRWEPAALKMDAGVALARAEEHGTTVGAAAGAAVALVLGGSWGAAREEEESRRRRRPRYWA
jgi:hypothetical protein